MIEQASSESAAEILFSVIRQRRSVRAFRPEPVPDEHVELLVDAARYAPTAGNRQPWCFLVVRDRENLERLRARLEPWLCQRIEASETTPEGRARRLESALAYLDGILVAPLFVFIFVDASTYPDLVAYDGALAAGNLMLAARVLGYGTCFQTTFFPEEIVRAYFGVPEEFRFIGAVPVGRPVEWPPTPPKKPIAELVCYERIEEES